ncbi:Hha/YmoA family nucleoid-associated regulatory protein [Escherichia coli]|uniref:Hha/YmoA family nucleoid-associated regulatory protein n=1 Tax=Escherichia coli TaxID=562 RepID=UPI00389115DC
MFRRCRAIDTVERLYEHKRDTVPKKEHMVDFEGIRPEKSGSNSCGKIWDKVPASAWKMLNKAGIPAFNWCRRTHV